MRGIAVTGGYEKFKTKCEMATKHTKGSKWIQTICRDIRCVNGNCKYTTKAKIEFDRKTSKFVF